MQLTGHEVATEAQRRRRAEKMRKRRERDEKSVRDGKMDADTLQRGSAHDVAFLYPVPFMYFAPVAGCVSVGGWNGGTCAGGAACAVVSGLLYDVR